MVLDAPTFNLVLTPEGALSLVQREAAHRGFKKIEVEEVRLIYTPFYLFSFDVRAEGNAPPIAGKAAINAYTGDISDLVPYIIDRPLNKTKNPSEGGEVEETAITIPEAKDATKDKIAAQTGLGREKVSVSAFSKVYIPFFRIWLEVGHTPLKVDVDALMGTPLGLEGLPHKEKTWGEATSETLSKLKTPSGWVDLTGKLIGSLTGGGKGGGHGEGGNAHGGGAGSVDHEGAGAGGFQPRILILIALVAVLAYYAFLQPATGLKCTGEISSYRSGCILRGVCEFSAKKGETVPVGTGAQIFIKDGRDTLYDYMENAMYIDSLKVPYNITFKPSGKACNAYGWGYNKI